MTWREKQGKRKCLLKGVGAGEASDVVVYHGNSVRCKKDGKEEFAIRDQDMHHNNLWLSGLCSRWDPDLIITLTPAVSLSSIYLPRHPV